MDSDVTWSVLLVAAGDIDAQLIAGHLAQREIPTFLEKDRTGYGDYLLGGSNPHAPVKVMVPEDRLAEALAVVGEEAAESDDLEPGHPAPDEVDVLARPSGTLQTFRSFRLWLAVMVIGVMLYVLIMENPLKDLIDIL